MAFTQYELDYYHSKGQIPDWMYYQMSDKPVWMKMAEQKQRLYDRIREAEEERKRIEEEKKLGKDIEKQIEKELPKTLEKALDELMKDFTK